MSNSNSEICFGRHRSILEKNSTWKTTASHPLHRQTKGRQIKEMSRACWEQDYYYKAYKKETVVWFFL